MSTASAPAASASEGPVEVRLLGRFAVSVDGEERAADGWPALRAAHLVQLLSLASARALPREQVIDALWPQLDPEAYR